MNDDRDDENQSRRHGDKWQFKREVSTGDLLIAVGFIVSAVMGYTSMDKRITVIEEKQAMQARIDDKQDAALRDGMRRIEDSLNNIQNFLRDAKK